MSKSQSVFYCSLIQPGSEYVGDVYGHGTYVAGIIGMDGTASGGVYQGIAPGADLYSFKVNDETGMAYEFGCCGSHAVGL